MSPDERVCPVCGFPLERDAVRCPACGREVGGEEELGREETIRLFMLLPGVGRKKAEALYDAGFRSIEDIRRAELSKLAGARGVGRALAERIQEHIESGGMEEHGLYLCPECGAFVSADAVMCPNCGADLSGGEEEIEEELEEGGGGEVEEVDGLLGAGDEIEEDITPDVVMFAHALGVKEPETLSSLGMEDEIVEDARRLEIPEGPGGGESAGAAGGGAESVPAEEGASVEVEEAETGPPLDVEQFLVEEGFKEDLDLEDLESLGEAVVREVLEDMGVDLEEPGEAVDLSFDESGDVSLLDSDAGIEEVGVEKPGAVGPEDVDLTAMIWDEEPEEEEVPLVVCPSCGAFVKKGAEVCDICGSPVPEEIISEGLSDGLLAEEEELQTGVDAFKRFLGVEGDEVLSGSVEEEKGGAVYLCPNCGAFVSETAETCPICGVNLLEYEGKVPDYEVPVEEEKETEMGVCPECGAFVDVSREKCEVCGADLREVGVLGTASGAEGEEPEKSSEKEVGLAVEVFKKALGVRPDVTAVEVVEEGGELFLCPYCGAFISSRTFRCPICGEFVGEGVSEEEVKEAIETEIEKALSEIGIEGETGAESGEETGEAGVSEEMAVGEETAEIEKEYDGVEAGSSEAGAGVMMCPVCGALVGEEDTVCPSCGALFAAGEEETVEEEDSGGGTGDIGVVGGDEGVLAEHVESAMEGSCGVTEGGGEVAVEAETAVSPYEEAERAFEELERELLEVKALVSEPSEGDVEEEMTEEPVAAPAEEAVSDAVEKRPKRAVAAPAVHTTVATEKLRRTATPVSVKKASVKTRPAVRRKAKTVKKEEILASLSGGRGRKRGLPLGEHRGRKLPSVSGGYGREKGVFSGAAGAVREKGSRPAVREEIFDPRWESYRGMFLISSVFVMVAMMLEYSAIKPYWEDYHRTYYVGVMVVFAIFSLVGYVFVLTGRGFFREGAMVRVLVFAAGAVLTGVVGFHDQVIPSVSSSSLAFLALVGIVVACAGALLLRNRVEQMVVWSTGSFFIFLFAISASVESAGDFRVFVLTTGSLLIAIAIGEFIYQKWEAFVSAVHLREGDEFLRKNRYREALDIYEKAVEANPDMVFDDTPWASKGAALIKMGRYEEALEALDTALRLNPGNEMAWTNKGIALTRLGRHEEAIKCYREAVKLNPNYEVVWNNLGNAYARLGMYDRALKCYDRALSIQPRYRDALINKGYVLVRQGKYEEAIACADRAATLASKRRTPVSVV